MNPVNMFIVEHIDVYLGVWAEENTKSNTNVPPEKQAIAAKARKPFLKTLMDRAAKNELRWCATQFPTAAAAQDAEMSLHEYEDFVFRGAAAPARPGGGVEGGLGKTARLVDYLNRKRKSA